MAVALSTLVDEADRYLNSSTGAFYYGYTPVAARRFGREFELAIRFNWGG